MDTLAVNSRQYAAVAEQLFVTTLRCYQDVNVNTKIKCTTTAIMTFLKTTVQLFYCMVNRVYHGHMQLHMKLDKRRHRQTNICESSTVYLVSKYI